MGTQCPTKDNSESIKISVILHIVLENQLWTYIFLVMQNNVLNFLASTEVLMKHTAANEAENKLICFFFFFSLHENS